MWIAHVILGLMGGTAFGIGMGRILADRSVEAYGLLAVAGAILLSTMIRELNRKF